MGRLLVPGRLVLPARAIDGVARQNNKIMLQDIVLLIKKIFVGVLVFLVPLAIFFAGLWLVRHVF